MQLDNTFYVLSRSGRTKKKIIHFTDKFANFPHTFMHVRTKTTVNLEVKVNTHIDGRRASSKSLPETQTLSFPTCWRGWDVKQRFFVPLEPSWLFSLLPSQLAARSRPTPHHTEQPMRGRLSILNPPTPGQSPGLQKHTGAGPGYYEAINVCKTSIYYHLKLNYIWLLWNLVDY